VEFHALDEAQAILEAVANHSLQRRVILQPKRGIRNESSETAR
jgi:hypothetical protein